MLWFVIPALDERENLPATGRRLAEACAAAGEAFRIVVVDDGSTDGTADVARAHVPNAEVLRHERNRGPGAAMDTGLRHVLARAGAGDLVVTLEADGTSDLAILPALVRLCREGGKDVALASVYGRGGEVRNTRVHRRVLSATANALCRGALGLRGVATYSSFYRVHRVEALRAALDRYGARMIEERGFTYAVELLVKLVRTGARLGEVPMVLDASQRVGKSRMKVLPTIRAYLRLIARLGLVERR
ncbi:MAG: glycosyltransferase [Planctomycetes bacterium]|nr:glycosyltransferase [Planctomycetota bacterium]